MLFRSVVRRHAHHRAGAVLRQHVVRDPDRYALAVERVDREPACGDAGLLALCRQAVDLRPAEPISFVFGALNPKPRVSAFDQMHAELGTRSLWLDDDDDPAPCGHALRVTRPLRHTKGPKDRARRAGADAADAAGEVVGRPAGSGTWSCLGRRGDPVGHRGAVPGGRVVDDREFRHGVSLGPGVGPKKGKAEKSNSRRSRLRAAAAAR